MIRTSCKPDILVVVDRKCQVVVLGHIQDRHERDDIFMQIVAVLDQRFKTERLRILSSGESSFWVTLISNGLESCSLLKTLFMAFSRS